MTLSVWVKANIQELKQIIYKGSLNAASEALTLYSTGGGVKINSNCISGAGWKGATYSEALPITVWTHLVLTYDGVSINIYKNGVLNSSVSATGLIDACIGGDLRFGFNHLVYSPSILGDPFNGSIDDIGMWNRALTASEIGQLFTGTGDCGYGNMGINVCKPERNLHVKDVLRLKPRDSAPANPGKGDIYFDGTLNKLRVYDGTTWQNCW